jgi:F-type H+-transporting ATPase subunit epsilon
MMFKLNFATPDKKIVADQELDEITLPAFRGELNILPGHSPLVTTLEAGILRYRLKNGETQKVAIGWGYCQVSPEGVNVLAETAVESDEIDTKVVSDRLKALEFRLANDSLDDVNWEHVQQDIARLKAELNLVGGDKNTH